jgi:hypothetical protein
MNEMYEYEWVFFQALSDLVRLVMISGWIAFGYYMWRIVRNRDAK